MKLTNLDNDGLQHREELFCELRKKLIEKKSLELEFDNFRKLAEELNHKNDSLEKQIFNIRNIIQKVIEDDIHPIQAKLQHDQNLKNEEIYEEMNRPKSSSYGASKAFR
jgi:hypothetical protein